MRWSIVAAVMPQAPAASWRSKSCGAIVVLPCGARSTPRVALKLASASMLLASADSTRVMSGNVKPALSRRGWPAVSSSMEAVLRSSARPFTDQGDGSRRRAAMAS